MRFSLFRHKVTIQTVTDGRDSSLGSIEPSWSTLATRWASIDPISGREYFAAQEVQSEVTHKISMRYDAALSGAVPKMRITYGSKTYQIESVINIDQRNKWLVFMCKEDT